MSVHAKVALDDTATVNSCEFEREPFFSYEFERETFCKARATRADFFTCATSPLRDASDDDGGSIHDGNGDDDDDEEEEEEPDADDDDEPDKHARRTRR